jgi:predicted nuclease of predicted toxin-antitoxin system
MKFLVDVNASGSLVDGLMRLGHDVSAVAEQDPRMRDEEILRWAVSEQRIIVTTDHDFEEMIWREGKSHCGVLRLENLPRAERRTLLEDVLHHHGQDLASGAIVIAQSGKIRIRRPFLGRASCAE